MAERRNSLVTEPGEREIFMTRVFDAPRHLVFRAWAEPEQVKRWLGPRTFTTPFCEIDFRPGGHFRYCMRSPEGREYWGRGVYREIVAPERIVYADSFTDEQGNVVPASHYGLPPDTPLETVVTVTFAEEGGKTKLTLRHVGIGGAAEGGWSESLERLAAELAEDVARSRLTLVAEPAQPTIVMTRVFDAPRRLVFEAYTKPEHLKRWWGPRGYTLPVCDMDFRPGGAWRFVQRGPDGAEYGFRGVYREIVPPERLVYTFEFDGMPGHVSLETLTFDEHDGRTTLTTTALFDSIEDRDGMLKSGMEAGAAESMDRLAELLATW